MPLIRNITVKNKVILIVMITCITALLLASILELSFQRRDSRKGIITSTLYYAEIIGYNCRAALDFEDTKDAEKTLKSFQSISSIVFASVYTNKGKLLARYQAPDFTGVPTPPSSLKEGYKFENGYFKLVRQVKENGESIGKVYIQLDLSQLKRKFWLSVLIVSIIKITCSFFAYLISFRLQKLISGPILSLTEMARFVSEEKDYSKRARKQTNDEVGLLIDAFNEMLEQIQKRDVALTDSKNKLEERVRERTTELTRTNEELTKIITEYKQTQIDLKETQERLMEAAHKAGMAEVAADVLHNVGNVLNSINVSTAWIKKLITDSEITNLEKLAKLVNDHTDDLGTFFTDNPKGKYVPVYLSEVSKCLIKEQEDVLSRLHILAKNVEHIKEIVSTQQSYAKIAAVEVPTNIAKLIEDAIQINSAGLERHGTTLIRQFDNLPDVQINKQKVLQILVNLINNAKYAVSSNGKEIKEIVIKLYQHSKDQFRIEVSDNGVGISRENLTKIFSHGFTTKANGHGFGLHSGALAAKEMNGSLTVQSDGQGHGAIFTVELPFKPVGITK